MAVLLVNTEWQYQVKTDFMLISCYYLKCNMVMFSVSPLSPKCMFNLIEYLLLDYTFSCIFPLLHQHLSVMKISCTTSQMVTEEPTSFWKLIFLLGTWRSGDGFEISFSPSNYTRPILFQPLEIISSSGLQVQTALVKKTSKYKTAVDWGIFLLRVAETSLSLRVSLGYVLWAQSKASQDEEHLQKQLQDSKK